MSSEILTEVIDVQRLGDQIATMAATIDAATHTLLTHIRAFDEAAGWQQHGAISCAHWLSWRIGLDLHTARERVRVARALGKLPAINEAFRKGTLSYAKVRALTRIAKPDTDATLADIGLASTGAQLEIICRRTRTAAAALAIEDGALIPEWSVRQRVLDNGLVRIEATLHPDEAALVMKALQAGRERLRGEVQPCGERPAETSTTADVRGPTGTSPGVPDEGHEGHEGQGSSACGADAGQTPPPNLADALVLAAESFLTQQAAASPAPERYQILIHLEQDVLGPDGVLAASLDDGTHVPAETLRRLSCDASRTTVASDRTGAPVDVGRKVRTVSGPLRRALWARDRGCRFPGCTHRLYVQAHHIQHWAHGGVTSLENTVLLCTRHHTLLHEGGFTVERCGDDSLLFRNPGGHVLAQIPMAPPAPDGAVECLREAQMAEGVAVDVMTSAGWLDDLFPPDYERIVEVAGGWA